MKVMYFKINEEPMMIEIENELEKLQEIVGGYIEPVLLNKEENIFLICNEEGKILGLPHNRFILNSSEETIDSIRGNFIVCQVDGEEFCSLSDSLVNQVTKYFK